MSNIDNILSQLPDDLKQRTQVDENLDRLKTEQNPDIKEQIITEILNELNSFENNLEDSLEENETRTKIEQVKREITEIKNQMDNLRNQIWNWNIWRVFEVTEEMEEWDLFGWEKKFWFPIIQWIEDFLHFFGIWVVNSDNKQISKTFEKLGYGDSDKIKDILDKLLDIKAEKLKPVLDVIDENITITEQNIGQIYNNHLSGKLTDAGISIPNNNEGKIILFRILKTFKLNKKLLYPDNTIQNQIKTSITATIKQKIWLSNTNQDKTVSDLLGEMFSHKWSSWDYALPDEGIKLINYRDNSHNATLPHWLDVEKLSDNDYKIWNVELKLKNNTILVKNENWTFKFSEIVTSFWNISPNITWFTISNNICTISYNNTLFNWNKSIELTASILEKIKTINENNLNLQIDGYKFKFEKVNSWWNA